MKNVNDEEIRRKASGCSCGNDGQVDPEFLSEMIFLVEMDQFKEIERRRSMKIRAIAAVAVLTAAVGAAVIIFAKNAGRNRNGKTHA